MTKNSAGQRIWFGVKMLWLSIAALVFFVTLYSFDDKPNSDIWVFLTWSMLILSFPAGLIVSLAHMVLGVGLSIAIETSHLSLAAEWLVYFVLGYLQWFVLIPYLVGKLWALKKQELR